MITSIKNIKLIHNLKIYKIEIINYLILAYAFTLSFPVEIKRVISILLILFWIADRSKAKIKLPNVVAFKIFTIFIIFSLISYFWSDVSLKEAFSYIKRYWYFLPIFIIFKYLKKEFVKYALSFFLFGMFISEILSYGNFFAFWQIGLGKTYDPTVFMQHSLYGIFLTITAYLLLSMLLNPKNSYKEKFIYLFFLTTVTINILINSGRTGYFTLFLGSFIIVFFIIKPKIKNILFFILTLISIFSLAYFNSINFKNRISQINIDISKITQSNNFNSSIGARIGFWIIAKKILEEKPLLGVGIANQINYKNELIKKMPKEEQKNYKTVQRLVHFHNNHLLIITQYGIIGYIIFLYCLYSILKIEIKNKTINILKISTVVTFFIGSFADMLLYLNTTMSLFAFCIGVVLAQYRIEKENNINY